MPIDSEELRLRFTNREPGEAQLTAINRIYAEGGRFADLINLLVPHSRELVHAVRRVEEAVMWARRGILERTTGPVPDGSIAAAKDPP